MTKSLNIQEFHLLVIHNSSHLRSREIQFIPKPFVKEEDEGRYQGEKLAMQRKHSHIDSVNLEVC